MRMKRRLSHWGYTGIFVMFAGLTCAAEIREESQGMPDPLCGPTSLAVVFERLGVEYEAKDLLQATGYTHENGTSLRGIEECARSYGLQTIALHGKLGDMLKLLGEKTCAIQGGGNHFSAIVFLNGRIHALDPAHRTVLSLSAQSRAISRPVLFISTVAIHVPPEWRVSARATLLQRILMGLLAAAGILFGCLAARTILRRRHASSKRLDQ
jgi:ABC-type bacteriocin/lantibiotic exporter with double-glycine peptidase domain